jgi:hypothetical protein
MPEFAANSLIQNGRITLDPQPDSGILLKHCFVSRAATQQALRVFQAVPMAKTSVTK